MRPTPFWAAYRRPTIRDAPAVVALARAATDEPPALGSLPWSWRYRHAPLPHRSLVTLDLTDGSLVAHAGGLRLPARLAGDPVVLTSLVDALCAPDYRYGTTGVPVFSELLVRWWEDGFGPGQAIAATAFVPRSLPRSAEGWSTVERTSRLERLVPSATASTPGATPSSTWSDRPPDDADALWSRCRAEHGLAVERDRTYLAWRYARHPARAYRFVAVRDATTLRGLAVLGAWPGDPTALALVDWIVPLDDAEAARRLLEEAERAARVAGRARLATWFPAAHAWRRAFLLRGFRPRLTDVRWVARFASPRLDLEAFLHRAYATPGDVASF